MKNYKLEEKLNKYIFDPRNSVLNFELACEYFDVKQYAAALSYYLRCAELSDDDDLVYESLLLSWDCMDRIGRNKTFERGQLLHIISQSPHRPEAYLMMCQWLEFNGEARIESKQEVFTLMYTYASIGISNEKNQKPFRYFNRYPGYYATRFYKAYVGWQIGKIKESEDGMIDLYNNHKHNMTEDYKVYIYNNIVNLRIQDRVIENKNENNSYEDDIKNTNFVLYDKSKFNRLKFKFEGSEKIDKNYAQAYQDIFVLSMLNGKKNGTYLEIGSSLPYYGSNTVLLEKEFDWEGISLDIDQNVVDQFKEKRNNKVICKDATKVDYKRLLDEFGHKTIDYLQVDCEPAHVTYDILLRIPLNKYKFGIITFEHDSYEFGPSIRDISRQYLESFGYVLVVNNVSPLNNKPFEDWWVHPDLIDFEIINKMKLVDGKTKNIENYILNDEK